MTKQDSGFRIQDSGSPVVLAAGGTGGHIFPAEALALELKGRGYSNITLITDRRFAKYGQDFSGFPIVTIRSGSPSGSTVARMKGIINIVFGILDAVKELKKIGKPVVIGFGGYPSFPTMIAALGLKLPTMIHEQNAFAGSVNKHLAKYVSKIALSNENTAGIGKELGNRVQYTGNPVRPAVREVREIPYPEISQESEVNLLVTGGSQGAAIFGKIVPEAVALLPEDMRSRLKVAQQCKAEDIERVKERYREMGVLAELEPFFGDVAKRLAAANLVICRAGASTVAELFTAGRPAILIPFSGAKDNHQEFNARVVEEKGAGWLMVEKEATPEALSAKLKELICDSGRLAEAARKAREAGGENAASRLADMVDSLALG